MPEYPQQSKIHRTIALFYDELNKAYDRDEAELQIGYVTYSNRIGVYIGSMFPQNNIANRLGVSGAEGLSLFRYVVDAGYIRLGPGSDLSTQANSATVVGVTPEGLYEIGELPDPRAELLLQRIALILTARAMHVRVVE